MKSPVEQFTIKTLVPLEAFGYDISFTNASLFMVLSVIVSSLFLYLGIKKSSLIPNRFQSSVELLYEFVSNMVKENVGCLLYTSPSPRDRPLSRMPSSA